MNEQLKKALQKCAEFAGLDAAKMVAEAEQSIEASKELRTKDNNITGWNASHGAELRTEVIYKDELYSMIAFRSKIIEKLPGNHGQIQSADTVKVPIIGEVGYFNRGAELGTDAVLGEHTADNTLSTAQAVLTFKKFKATFVVSRETLRRTVANGGNVYNMIQNKIVEGFDKTINSFLINGDTDTANTNINGITDLTAWGKDHRIGTDGIRKVGANNTIVGGTDVAYSRALLKGMMDKVELYVDDSEKLLWIMSNNFANKVRFDTTYSTQDVFGNNASNTNGGYVMRPEGIEAYISRDYAGALAATGKYSGAGTYVGASLLYRPAVQYAFGEDMVIMVHEFADGLVFDAVGYFAYDIINWDADGIGKTVATAVCLK